jgi:DNA-binding LytR/AlgR family response regulator
MLPERAEDADLVFLDMDSVDVHKRATLGIGKKSLIVISGDAGNAIRSYSWHPSAFLKPDLGAMQLMQALDAAGSAWRDGWLCLDMLYHRKPLRIPVGRVRYVEAYRNYCLLNQKKQSARVRLMLGELEDMIPAPPFVRCHKSYLVHLDMVGKISYNSLTLRDDGVRLPVGRSYHDSFRQSLEAWQKGDP